MSETILYVFIKTERYWIADALGETHWRSRPGSEKVYGPYKSREAACDALSAGGWKMFNESMLCFQKKLSNGEKLEAHVQVKKMPSMWSPDSL